MGRVIDPKGRAKLRVPGDFYVGRRPFGLLIGTFRLDIGLDK